MAKQTINVKEIFYRTWTSKTVTLAFILNTAIIAFLSGQVPNIQDTAFAFVVMVGVAYGVSPKLRVGNFINSFGVGVLSYGVYSLAMHFLKLTGSAFVIQTEILLAASFGFICAIIYALVEIFEK